MANFTDTVLLEARAKVIAQLNEKFELRPTMGKLINMAMQDRSLTIPALDQIKQAETQATFTTYLKRLSDTVDSEKSCDPTGVAGDSGKVELVWQTIAKTYEMSYKRHNGNEYKAAEVLAYGLMELEKKILTEANGLDAQIAAFLETNKTQVNALATNPSGYNTWDAANYKVDVPFADKERFYTNMLSEMAINNYEGEMLEGSSTNWRGDAIHFSQQGSANSENLSYQFDPAMQVSSYLSNNLVPDNAGGEGSVHYIVPKGGIALLDWNDPLNRNNVEDNNGKRMTYNSILAPGLTFDLYIKEDCADTSATGGGKQDKVDKYEMSLNFALSTQPFSTAGESAIHKYSVAKS